MNDGAALAKSISTQLAARGWSLEVLEKNPPQYREAIQRIREELGTGK